MVVETASPVLPLSSASPIGHSVIYLVNRLPDIFAKLGSESTIELPQFVVVGSQSNGKSSILEALVGRDLLPRGSRIYARHPPVLQVIHTNHKADDTDEEYGEYIHLNEKRFFDFFENQRELWYSLWKV